jgi:hypothetical protein
VLNEKTLPAAILVNAVYFLGLFTFAILLGVVGPQVGQVVVRVLELVQVVVCTGAELDHLRHTIKKTTARFPAPPAGDRRNQNHV